MGHLQHSFLPFKPSASFSISFSLSCLIGHLQYQLIPCKPRCLLQAPFISSPITWETNSVHSLETYSIHSFLPFKPCASFSIGFSLSCFIGHLQYPFIPFRPRCLLQDPFISSPITWDTNSVHSFISNHVSPSASLNFFRWQHFALPSMSLIFLRA